MTNTPRSNRPVLSMAAGIFSVAAIIVSFGIGKLTGLVDSGIAKRGVAAMMGIMLVVIGNFVPKMRLFKVQGEAPDTGAVDRFAGWMFVIAGLVFAAIWIFAPLDKAALASPMIGIAAFLLVLARWLVWKGDRREGLLPHLTPGRILIAILLGTVFWGSGIFLADRLWGDAVAQWMSIAYAIALPLVMIPIALFIRSTAGEAKD